MSKISELDKVVKAIEWLKQGRLSISFKEAQWLCEQIQDMQDEIKCLKETNEEHLKINGDLRKENQELKEDVEEISTSHFSLFKRYDKIEKENQKLVKVINELENYLKVGIAMNYNMNNDKYSEQTVDNYTDILNKLTELKGGSDDVEN